MSFTQGFEKTAFIAPAIGAIRGTTSKATKGTVKAVKGYVGSQKAKGVSAYRKASGRGSEFSPGSGLAIKRNKGKTPTSDQSAKARSDVFARKDRSDNAKTMKKPSFARKHPFLTAGGLYLGARAAFGGDDKNQTQQPGQPQVMSGQY